MSNTRRSRGYAYEHTLVQRLNNGVWNARRLGGSSTGLPDIVAVNNTDGILLTIEAKSGTSDRLYVPQDQIERCLIIRNMFGIYPERHIILAFKFMSKKRFRRKKETVYESRKLLEYYKVADVVAEMSVLPIIKCTYDGRTFAIRKNKTVALNLPDYSMPFQKITRQVTLQWGAGRRNNNIKNLACPYLLGMKKTVSLEFSELHEKVAIELDDSLSPKTVRAIIGSLPIKMTINRWGDELYTDETPVRVEEEKNAKSVVNLMDVAYWPEGSALCFFYGPTPVSKQGKIMPYSPVNVIGRILTRPANVQEFLKSIEESHINKKLPVTLR